jgi:hypothetical protein
VPVSALPGFKFLNRVPRFESWRGRYEQNRTSKAYFGGRRLAGNARSLETVGLPDGFSLWHKGFRRHADLGTVCRGIEGTKSQVGCECRRSMVPSRNERGYRGIPAHSAYCGAKHAVEGFTESVRCPTPPTQPGASRAADRRRLPEAVARAGEVVAHRPRIQTGG